MTALLPRTRFIVWLLLAGVGLALFFSGEYRDLGLPLGWVGSLLFVAAVWFCVDALHRIPHGDEEAMIAPGEWQAWVGLAFASTILTVMLASAPVFQSSVPISHNPDAAAVGRRIGTLFVAWTVLVYALRRRWAGQVQEDERDMRFKLLAGQWGRGATVFCVVGIALMLGFSPTDRLQQLGFPFIAHLSMCALLLGAWFDEVVAVILYWRDRR